MYAQIAAPLPIQPLTYKIPANYEGLISRGSAVEITIKNKKHVGYILSLHEKLEENTKFTIKNISGVPKNTGSLPLNLLELLLWISEYYHYPIGEVIQSALPPNTEIPYEKFYRLLRKPNTFSDEEIKKLRSRGGKKWSLIQHINEFHQISAQDSSLRPVLQKLIRDNIVEEFFEKKELSFLTDSQKMSASAPPPLSAEQAEAFDTIQQTLLEKKFQPFLLEGVTGSGKTEVYLHCAELVLQKKRSVLFMVPEIALTPQLFSRVTNRLGSNVAILHSGLTNKQRSEQWQLIRSGKAQLILGARSTIFAPAENIGLIIVDEEHESAFKQEDRLRYNARDLAVLRAQKERACIILGSATPSLETYYNAISGKYKHLQLKTRVTGSILPKVNIVDLKKTENIGSFSPSLIKKISENLEDKKQCMLFLNRRGFSSYITCGSCGDVPKCPNCSVSLTYYQKNNILLCHYCEYKIPKLSHCSKCQGDEWKSGTLGTESIEQQTKELFPRARVIRIDRESTQKRDSLEAALLKIANGDVDIIIGTQMIAKGHDYPNIQLVSILNADASTNIPDFRSAERAFQLFTQMAGRAGRSEWRGDVVLQTFNPHHPSIVSASTHDFKFFAEAELEIRKTFHYPPFYKLARIIVTDVSEAKAKKFCDLIANDILKIQKNSTLSLELLGPAPAVLTKIQNKYRWNLLLKSEKSANIQSLLKSRLSVWREAIHKSCSLQVDVDPLSLL